MKKTKISIIVPVYNVEKYINQCIDSIINQNICSCEVLLIDDGSTDNSGKICDQYSNKFDFITTIHQDNIGLSGARNTGIRKANSEYVMFIDSDDYISEHVNLNNIIEKLKDDIIQYKFIYYYEQKNKYIYLKNYPIYSDNKGITDYLLKSIKDGSFSGCACDKFFKLDLIKENDLYFKEGIVCEDMEWMLRLYPYVNSISKINEDIYVYRQQRIGSITNNVKTKNINCLFDIIKYWYYYSFDNEIFKIIYMNFLAYHYIILISEINKSNCSKKTKNDIYKLKKILDYNDNPKVRVCKSLIDKIGLKMSILIFRNYIKLKNYGLFKY